MLQRKEWCIFGAYNTDRLATVVYVTFARFCIMLPLHQIDQEALFVSPD